MMTFGKKLEMLRKERGLSQEELSIKLDVSRQAISKWELGTVMPDAKNIIVLSNVFGVSTDYLLKDECENKSPSLLKTTENKEVPVKETYYRPISLKIGWVAIGLGIVGILIMAVLSSVYPATIYDPPQGEIRSIISTGFWAFLELHNIYWLFGLCCILILFGMLIHFLCRRSK